MNYIDVTSTKIENAKETHYQYIRYIIKKKINGKSFKEAKPFSNITNVHQVTGIHSTVRNFLNDDTNLEKVLKGNPLILNSLKDIFKYKKQKDSLKKIIDYDGWDDITFYNPYDLAKNLDIPTCVYCNRMYTKTVQTDSHKKITRPTFDHWFPQSKYPLLALSFFNLVPSCNTCNSSVKGSTPFEIDKHFHPYLKSSVIEKFDFSFSYNYKDLTSFNFKVDPKNELSKTTLKLFKIEEIYTAHEDEIKDLKRLRDVYSDKYLDILYKDILGKTVDKDEIYRLAFGTHIDDANFDRRPLSKMKKDILKELGII